MENEIFTPLLEQFMSSPLVTWVSIHFFLTHYSFISSLFEGKCLEAENEVELVSWWW